MARFIGSVQGGRGEASRLGDAKNGIRAQAQGWTSGVKVYGFVDDQGRDVFQIIQTSGSKGNHSDREIGRIIDGELRLDVWGDVRDEIERAASSSNGKPPYKGDPMAGRVNYDPARGA